MKRKGVLKKKKGKIIIKNIIRFLNNKIFYFSILIITSEVIITLILKNKGYLSLKEEDFRWLLSASAQSMAALFALIGLFLSFRIEFLNHLITSYRNNVRNSIKLIPSYMINEFPECWAEDEIEEKASRIFTNLKQEELITISSIEILGVENFLKDLDYKINSIFVYKLLKKKIIDRIKYPLLLILLTFLISIILLPFNSAISRNETNIIFFLFHLILITITTILIYINFLDTIKLSKNI